MNVLEAGMHMDMEEMEVEMEVGKRVESQLGEVKVQDEEGTKLNNNVVDMKEEEDIMMRGFPDIGDIHRMVC